MKKKDAYYHTDESADEYIKLAKDVDGSAHIEKLRPFLKPNASILELGTGPGSDWELLNANYEVTGSDLSQAFLERLNAKYPQGNFLNLDAETIQISQTFDAIYSNKVLHHLTGIALANSILNQARILAADGIICHTFWRGQGSEEFKGMFVNYHEQVDLKRFFESKFEVLISQPYTEFEPDDSILFIAKKK